MILLNSHNVDLKCPHCGYICSPGTDEDNLFDYYIYEEVAIIKCPVCGSVSFKPLDVLNVADIFPNWILE